jgi:hypothetical protein
MGATGEGSVCAKRRNRLCEMRDVKGFGRLTGVSASTTIADSVAVDLPGNVAFAVVVIDGRIDGTALFERADQWRIANGLIRSGHPACFCRSDTVFGGVLSCRRTVVHHVAAIVLRQRTVSMVRKA